MMYAADERDDSRRVGYVLKPHGVAGGFVMHCDSDRVGWLAERETLTAATSRGDEIWHLISAKPHKGGLIVRVAELADRDAVESQRGTVLYVPDADAQAAVADDFFFYSDLVGLHLIDCDGGDKGRVTGVLDLPNNTQLEVAHESHTYLVPFVRAIVRQVDIPAKRILVHLPDGLMELGQ